MLLPSKCPGICSRMMALAPSTPPLTSALESHATLRNLSWETMCLSRAHLSSREDTQISKTSSLSSLCPQICSQMIRELSMSLLMLASESLAILKNLRLEGMFPCLKELSSRKLSPMVQLSSWETRKQGTLPNSPPRSGGILSTPNSILLLRRGFASSSD